MTHPTPVPARDGAIAALQFLDAALPIALDLQRNMNLALEHLTLPRHFQLQALGLSLPIERHRSCMIELTNCHHALTLWIRQAKAATAATKKIDRLTKPLFGPLDLPTDRQP